MSQGDRTTATLGDIVPDVLLELLTVSVAAEGRSGRLVSKPTVNARGWDISPPKEKLMNGICRKLKGSPMATNESETPRTDAHVEQMVKAGHGACASFQFARTLECEAQQLRRELDRLVTMVGQFDQRNKVLQSDLATAQDRIKELTKERDEAIEAQFMRNNDGDRTEVKWEDEAQTWYKHSVKATAQRDDLKARLEAAEKERLADLEPLRAILQHGVDDELWRSGETVISAIVRHIAVIQKDCERLDWLENPLSQNHLFGTFVMGGSKTALRAAIDSEMRTTTPPEQ